MVRNYAKQTGGLFTRTAAKIAAMTVLQYINFCNHRKIGRERKTNCVSRFLGSDFGITKNPEIVP